MFVVVASSRPSFPLPRSDSNRLHSSFSSLHHSFTLSRELPQNLVTIPSHQNRKKIYEPPKHSSPADSSSSSSRQSGREPSEIRLILHRYSSLRKRYPKSETDLTLFSANQARIRRKREEGQRTELRRVETRTRERRQEKRTNSLRCHDPHLLGFRRSWCDIRVRHGEHLELLCLRGGGEINEVSSSKFEMKRDSTRIQREREDNQEEVNSPEEQQPGSLHPSLPLHPSR